MRVVRAGTGRVEIRDYGGLAELIQRHLEDAYMLFRVTPDLAEALDATPGSLVSIDWPVGKESYDPERAGVFTDLDTELYGVPPRRVKRTGGGLESTWEMQQRAARDLGVSRNTLVRYGGLRLAIKPPTHITWELVRKLIRWTGDREGVEDAVLTEGARRMRRDYLEFLRTEVDRLREGRCETDGWEDHGDVGIADEVEAFQKFADARGVPWGRVELALLRVFDPLLGWKRLRDRFIGGKSDTLTKVMKQGFLRERFLITEESRLLGPLDDVGPLR